MKKYGPVLVLVLLVIFATLKIWNTYQANTIRQEIIPQNASPFDDLPEDFVAFYQQFHQDSSYQMQHIQFPLAGLPSMVNPDDFTESGYFYEAASWKMHKPVDTEQNRYEHRFDQVGTQYLIIEKIRDTETGIGLERRFVRQDGRWMLIYYSGMNKMQPIN